MGGEIVAVLAQRGSVFGNCLSLQSLKNAENCPAENKFEYTAAAAARTQI